MPVITVISGIPLFTTIQEALDWAAANGLSGYHTHFVGGQQGYMGGSNHASATRSGNGGAAQIRPNISGASSASSSSSSSGGSSGGGGGGY